MIVTSSPSLRISLKTLLIVISVVVSLVLSLDPARAGAKLFDFTASNFHDQRKVDTSELRGKVMVLLFGSIYCKPCIELLPVFNKLQKQYRQSDVRFFALDIDQSVDDGLLKRFVKKHDIQTPYIVNAHKIAKNNRICMLPTTLIINRKGEIVDRIFGFQKAKTLDRAIKKLKPQLNGRNH